MVMAMLIGLGLGVTGGLLLGGQMFKGHEDIEDDRYHYLDIEADNDDNVPEPTSGKDMSPEFREILKYAPKWTTWPDFEQVRWVNSTIEWLWPNLTRGVCKMVTDMIKPMLEDVVAQQAMLDEIVIEELDLGPYPMRLAGLKVYDTKDDEVILEAPVQWGSAVKIHVRARVRLGPASIVVPLKVEDVQVSATARVTIRPLVDTLPCLGAIAISLTESPYVDLSVKAITGMDLLAVPFVHEAMTMAVKMATEKICVYPNQIPVPLMENSGLPTPPVGMLELTVQRCGNLRSKDLVGAGDPYVKISVLTMGTAKDKHGKETEIVAKEEPPHFTQVKSKKNPEFNEHFKILVPAMSPKHVLAFRVFDKDMLGLDDVMGEYDIVLDKDSDAQDNAFLRSGEETQMTLNLMPEKGTQERMKGIAAGELYVMMQYTPFYNADGADGGEDADDPGKAMEKVQQSRKARVIDDSTKGVLTAEIYRCVDLPLIGKSCDSYVELRLSDPDNPNGPDVRMTPTILNERSPRYRFKSDFVYVSATSTLTLSVFDHPDKLELSNIVKLGMKSDTLMGKVRIHVRDVAKTGRVKDQFPLADADQGDMHVQLTWTSVERDD